MNDLSSEVLSDARVSAAKMLSRASILSFRAL